MIPKFRAWDVLAEEMIDEILMISFVRKEIIGKFRNGSTSVPLKFEDKRNGEDVILMQSTGLKDKNGVEIFEGDVVSRNSGMPNVVEFGKWIYEEDFGYKIKNIGFYLNSSYDDDELFQAMDYEDIRKNYEVIGNIYENPELLEDKE